jgi:hypothetical protein
VEQDGTVVGHHVRYAPQDEILEINAPAGVIRFAGDLATSPYRRRDEQQVESLR